MDSDSQFILTCISTGGPVTTITWTIQKNYYPTPQIITEGNETVLDDPMIAQYTHTLTVTERQGGVYTCTVANRVSQDHADIEGETAGCYHCCSISTTVLDANTPFGVRVSQTKHNCVLVSWRYLPEWPDVPGFSIFYKQQHGSHSGSVAVRGRERNATVTGMIVGTTYSISVAAKTNTLPSYPATFTPRMCLQ